MERYLLYDAGCTTCSQLAEVVQDAVGTSLQTRSLHEQASQELLEVSLGPDWRFAPYVVTVDGDQVRAVTGLRAAVQLALWMGPKRAWRVWRLVNRQFVSRRRNFLQQAGASLLALFLLNVNHVDRAEAQTMCNCWDQRCRRLYYQGCSHS